MEPLDFPNSDPGPRSLLVGASMDENAKRMEWAMARAWLRRALDGTSDETA